MAKKVFERKCRNCLFSGARLVSEERKNEILEACRRKKSHFTCHKSKRRGSDSVMCRGYWEKEFTDLERGLAQAHGWVEFVDQKDDCRLPSFSEMSEGAVEKK